MPCGDRANDQPSSSEFENRGPRNHGDAIAHNPVDDAKRKSP